MKIYTKTGDQGDTGLYGGGRVAKDHPRIEAIGAVDELNAEVGLVRAELGRLAVDFASLDEFLRTVQNQLFDLGAELATPEPQSTGTVLIGEPAIEALELAIDLWEADLEPLRQFILPGGTEAAARLHRARCVCRRSERLLVALARQANLRPEAVVYLNRLSDLLFVLARTANRLAGTADVAWQKSDE